MALVVVVTILTVVAVASLGSQGWISSVAAGAAVSSKHTGTNAVSSGLVARPIVVAVTTACSSQISKLSLQLVNSILEFVADPALLRLSIVVLVWAGSFLMFTSCCISNKRIFLSKVHESKWDLPPQFIQVGFALSVRQYYTDHLLFSLVVHHSHLFEDNSFILNSVRGRLAGVVLGGLSPIILDVVIGTKDFVFDIVTLITEVVGAGL